MFRELFAILIINILPGLCQEVKVDQGHKLLIVKNGKSVELSCKHYTETNYVMSWYQQKAGEGLKLMVYSTDAKSGDMEQPYKAWTFNRPHILNSTLSLAQADIQLSAVYFCAVSRGNTVAYFGAGTILSVLGEKEKQIEPKVRLFPPDKQEFKEHGLLSLVCVASGFFPEHVRLTWYLNNEKIESMYQNVPKLDTDNTYSTSSRLSLMESQYFNPDTKIRCEAAFVGSNITASDETHGELGCGVSKESYGRYMNQGKISYIMVMFKSGLYAVIVMAVIWRRKALSGSC